MKGQFHRPTWRERFSEGVKAIELTFCKLARVQFEAPWNNRGREGC